MTSASPLPLETEDLGRAPRWSQDRRLRFIDFRLQWQGRLNRTDLTSFFGISVPQASADISKYAEQAPKNIHYDRSSRTYVRGPSFQMLFDSSGSEQYLAQLLAIDRGILDPAQALIGSRPPTESVLVPNRTVDRSILSSLLHAIEASQTVRVCYQSIARDEPRWRDISPHAMCTDGLRWHTRAYCHLRDGFRDLVLGRILALEDPRPSNIDVALDHEWHNLVQIILAPNPDLSQAQREGVEIDYGMRDGAVTVECREAMLFYTLRTLNFDHRGVPREGERQLVIRNLDQLLPVLPRPGQG
ncbi:WYL domain-containing protein [Variovorax sp. J22G73]|uniref:WYL domain-containing protein n=1 Tax=unclassified Variovorax TaxID=663243 RepID=UPI002577B60F|nr:MULTISPECIES: WYL domain-containing protein [unclassified Variovorax]MDM0008385.1 WYL domain-containing protein [Variovorax sp. J22R203]MDM0100892.1 WYL domain-containing protein [Variovorax sp. J22G73]